MIEMDNKSDLREITSSLHFLRMANACLTMLCVVLIGTSGWLIAENQSHHNSIAVLRKSVSKLSQPNAILMEDVKMLNHCKQAHGESLEKPGEIVGVDESHSIDKSFKKREVQSQILTISGLLETIQGLRGPAGLPGRDGKDGADGKDGRDAVNFHAVDRHINTTVHVLVNQEMAKVRLAANELSQVSGAIYTRWGRTVCRSTSDLVMKGIAAGTYARTQGGAAEYICLPDNPDLLLMPAPLWINSISGVEYGESDFFNQGSMKDHNAPCVVCLTKGRSVQKMFPAKSTCPDATWTKEYRGFLMTQHATHYRTQYVCVDSFPEAIPGLAHNANGALWIHVAANCTAGIGALGACPPYNSNTVLGCVVCSK